MERRLTDQIAKEGRPKGMQELERHHAAINCWKSAEQNNLGETEGSSRQTTEG